MPKSKAKSKAQDAPAAYSSKVIAQLFDLTQRRVQQLSQKGIIPRAEGGEYELVGVVRGYVQYLREQVEQAHKGEHTERLTKAQADLAELKYQRERENVVPIAQFTAIIEDLCTRFNAQIDALPRKWAPDLLECDDIGPMVEKLDTLKEELRAELRVEGGK